MVLPGKSFKKFIGAYLTATAPFLKLRYDSKNEVLSYQYYSKDKQLIRLITISDNYDKILEFFDLAYLKDKDLRTMTNEEFNYGILYSVFFNARVANYKDLVEHKASKSLVQAFYTQRKRDLLEEDNYMFVDNRYVIEGMLDTFFPKIKLYDTITKIEDKAESARPDTVQDEKMMMYANVVKWVPDMAKLGMDKVLGIVSAHQSYIKDVYKRDLIQYTKENDLDKIIKNFKAYVTDMKLVN